MCDFFLEFLCWIEVVKSDIFFFFGNKIGCVKVRLICEVVRFFNECFFSNIDGIDDYNLMDFDG